MVCVRLASPPGTGRDERVERSRVVPGRAFSLVSAVIHGARFRPEQQRQPPTAEPRPRMRVSLPITRAHVLPAAPACVVESRHARCSRAESVGQEVISSHQIHTAIILIIGAIRTNGVLFLL